MIYHEQCRGKLEMSVDDIVSAWKNERYRGFKPPRCPHCHAVIYSKDTIPCHVFADCITSISVENGDMLQLIATAYHHLEV